MAIYFESRNYCNEIKYLNAAGNSGIKFVKFNAFSNLGIFLVCAHFLMQTQRIQVFSISYLKHHFNISEGHFDLELELEFEPATILLEFVTFHSV